MAGEGVSASDSERKGVGARVWEGFGWTVLAVFVVFLVLLALIYHSIGRKGLPEATDHAQSAMADAHGEAIGCLEGIEEDLAGLADRNGVVYVAARCFHRVDSGTRVFPLRVLVNSSTTEVAGLHNSLQFGSYLLELTVEDSVATLTAVDAGSGSSQTVIMATTEHVTLAQCWTAEIDLQTGELGGRTRVECGEDVADLVYGIRDDQGGKLLGD